jgi:hypothetical protein
MPVQYSIKGMISPFHFKSLPFIRYEKRGGIISLPNIKGVVLMLELIGLITVGFIGMLIWNACTGDEVHIKFTVDNRDIIKYDKNKDKDLKEDSEK